MRLAGGPAEPELGYLCDVYIGGYNLNYLRKLRYHIFGYLVEWCGPISFYLSIAGIGILFCGCLRQNAAQKLVVAVLRFSFVLVAHDVGSKPEVH